MKFPVQAPLGIALCIIMLTTTTQVSHATSYLNLGSAVLRVGELPAEFNNTATRTYTKTVSELRVTVRNGSESGDKTCQTPNSFVAGPYRQAMIQGFGHTGPQLSDARICSYIYATVSSAHKSFVGLAHISESGAKLFGSKRVPSHLGSESSLVVGKSFDQMVFRKDNYVADYYCSDAGLTMGTASFAGLGTKLLSRLH